jgi:outer membrane protein OmpA-like peptidoglycan-associated protein
MKKIVLIFICSLFVVLGNAQNKDRKWQVNAGMNGVLYRYPIDITENIQKIDKVNWGWPLSQISLSRHLAAGFSPELHFSTAKVAYDPTVEINKTLLINGILHLKYSFANGYLLSTNSFLEPFLKGGGGITYKNQYGDKFFKTISFGGGFALWFTKEKNFGLQIQQLYSVVPDVKYNKEDYFNHSITLSYRWGLKDTDGDGVKDKYDNCPDEPGLKELGGCPDKDGDGVTDKKDDCPDEKGLKEFNGCPDTDGDGIPDKGDECPKEVGPLTTKGCPDKDSDGIADKVDECPEKPGIPEFKGCPDFDLDSIPDHLDKCPQEKGLKKFEGCPDRDNDSVPDNLDKCPDIFGVVAKEGCPEDTAEADAQIDKINDQIAFHAKSIFFQNGRARILSKSHAQLNEIANIIKSAPGSTFYVEGHTSNQGSEAYNLKLSKDRATSILNYLISKGVDPSNVISEGYGIRYPIADNNTEAGRAKNRRVDISIKK